jgi:PAS domain S-box-containing protein
MLVLAYASVSAIWILLSDVAVEIVFTKPETLALANTLKGWAFVMVTSVLLYFTVMRLVRARLSTDEDMRRVMSYAGDAIWICDAEFRFIYANPVACSLLGYSPDEYRGLKVRDLLATESLADSPESLHRLELGEVILADTVFFPRTGTPVTVELTFQRLPDGRYIGIGRDVTEKRRTEKLLDGERNLLRTLVQTIPDLVWLKDTEGRYLLCNSAFEKFFGVPEAQIVGKTDNDFVPAEQAAFFGEKDRIVLATGKPSTNQEWLTFASDGHRSMVETVKVPLRGVDEKPLGVLGIARDITLVREAELALRERLELRDRLARVVDVIPGVLFSLRRRPDGTLELPYVSAQVQQYWGVSPESLRANVGQFWGAIHPQDMESIRRNMEGSARTLDPTGTEFRVIHPVRGEIWAQTRSTPTREADGSILWSGFIEDVTERRRAERALVESERRYRRLIENMQSGVTYCEMEFSKGQPVNFTFIDVNAAFGRLTGLSNVVGKRATEVLPGIYESDRRLFEICGRVTQTGTPEVFEIRLDALKAWFTVSAYCLEPGHFVAVFDDISEHKRAAEQVESYVKRLEQSTMATAKAVGHMVELRDPYTAGHEGRVADLSVAIAAELGLSHDLQTGLRVMGELHDVGKIAVPAEILAKPGKLTPVEFEIVKNHAQQGYDILKLVDFPWPVADGVYQHHERLDGSGYPTGLKGDQIGIEGRILAVADTVEAMASHRPYRAGLGLDVALQEIERGAGTTYDAAVVKACIKVFREGGYQLPDPG